MDENSKEKLEAEGGQEQQVMFFAPELLQAAQQRSERLELLRDAAESGDRAAAIELAIYDLGAFGDTPRNGDEAFRLLSEHSEGDPVARYYLAYCYDTGAGVAADFVRAAELLTESAAQGYPPALDTLGYCYENGHGVPQDLEKAAAHYRAAAEQGHPEAMCNLALLYLHGKGVEKDAERGAAQQALL